MVLNSLLSGFDLEYAQMKIDQDYLPTVITVSMIMIPTHIFMFICLPVDYHVLISKAADTVWMVVASFFSNRELTDEIIANYSQLEPGKEKAKSFS
eukprot:NODE_7245_length_466_cov_24.577938_g6418_i0.p1 GENE.NODE_7245_length_466_cov_24.577938_g6418_i0~~NODE_7245_length_466_cov_24.577938_g6418_i0.p1  ORF type:complete len:96 (-),score=9.53 NODE_7245_length_466_cov_24.577938_g6418_i0:93-380(-)